MCQINNKIDTCTVIIKNAFDFSMIKKNLCDTVDGESQSHYLVSVFMYTHILYIDSVTDILLLLVFFNLISYTMKVFVKVIETIYYSSQNKGSNRRFEPIPIHC